MLDAAKIDGITGLASVTEETMSEQAAETTQGTTIVGWEMIAKAVTKALDRSVSVPTARRYAAPGHDNRLPVVRFEGCKDVFLRPLALKLWVELQKREVPIGMRPSGRSRPRRKKARRAKR